MNKDITQLLNMNIRELLDYLKVEVLYINPFNKTNLGNSSQTQKLATVQEYNNTHFIYLDSTLYEDQHQFLHDFIIVHEIGHIVHNHLQGYIETLAFLTDNKKSTNIIHAKMEYEANSFAMQYMMQHESTTEFEIKQFLLESYKIKI